MLFGCFGFERARIYSLSTLDNKAIKDLRDTWESKPMYFAPLIREPIIAFLLYAVFDMWLHFDLGGKPIRPRWPCKLFIIISAYRSLKVYIMSSILHHVFQVDYDGTPNIA